MNALRADARIDFDPDNAKKKWLIITLSTTKPPVPLRMALWFVSSADSLVQIEPLLISMPSTGFPEALTQSQPQVSLKISLESILDQVEKA